MEDATRIYTTGIFIEIDEFRPGVSRAFLSVIGRLVNIGPRKYNVHQ